MKLEQAIARVGDMANAARLNEAKRRHAAEEPGKARYSRETDLSLAEMYAAEAQALEAVLHAAMKGAE